MMNSFKNFLKKNRHLSMLAYFTYFLLFGVNYIKITGKEKKYPKILQFAITNKCNSMCVMCNIWKQPENDDLQLEDLKRLIQDPLFKKVKTVGINGGEPYLVNDLHLYVKEILTLPQIKDLNIISNGFVQEKTFQEIQKIYNLCKAKNVFFSLTFSLDGYGETHAKVRRIKDAFQKVTNTIERIESDKINYCDSLNLGCTISKYNVDEMNAMDVFCKSKNIPVDYHLAVPIKRIETEDLVKDFSVFSSFEATQSAKEFFFRKYLESRSLDEKFKYFSFYYFLKNGGGKRLPGCPQKLDCVTLNTKCDMFYCTVASDKIGNLNEAKGEDIFLKKENLQYRANILKNECEKCIHTYGGKIHITDFMIFMKSFLFENIWYRIYRFKNLFL